MTIKKALSFFVLTFLYASASPYPETASSAAFCPRPPAQAACEGYGYYCRATSVDFAARVNKVENNGASYYFYFEVLKAFSNQYLTGYYVYNDAVSGFEKDGFTKYEYPTAPSPLGIHVATSDPYYYYLLETAPEGSGGYGKKGVSVSIRDDVRGEDWFEIMSKDNYYTGTKNLGFMSKMFIKLVGGTSMLYGRTLPKSAINLSQTKIRELQIEFREYRGSPNFVTVWATLTANYDTPKFVCPYY